MCGTSSFVRTSSQALVIIRTAMVMSRMAAAAVLTPLLSNGRSAVREDCGWPCERASDSTCAACELPVSTCFSLHLFRRAACCTHLRHALLQQRDMLRQNSAAFVQPRHPCEELD